MSNVQMENINQILFKDSLYLCENRNTAWVTFYFIYLFFFFQAKPNFIQYVQVII